MHPNGAYWYKRLMAWLTFQHNLVVGSGQSVQSLASTRKFSQILANVWQMSRSEVALISRVSLIPSASSADVTFRLIQETVVSCTAQWMQLTQFLRKHMSGCFRTFSHHHNLDLSNQEAGPLTSYVTLAVKVTTSTSTCNFSVPYFTGLKVN